MNYTCSEAAMQGSILLLPLLDGVYLVLNLLSSEAVVQSSIRRCSRRAGSSGEEERGTGAASGGSGGTGSAWHRGKLKFIAKQCLKSKWRGEPFTAEHGAPASELNCSEYLPCDLVWFCFFVVFFPSPPNFTAPALSFCLYLDVRVDRKRSEFIRASQFIKPAD